MVVVYYTAVMLSIDLDGDRGFWNYTYFSILIDYVIWAHNLMYLFELVLSNHFATERQEGQDPVQFTHHPNTTAENDK